MHASVVTRCCTRRLGIPHQLAHICKRIEAGALWSVECLNAKCVRLEFSNASLIDYPSLYTVLVGAVLEFLDYSQFALDPCDDEDAAFMDGAAVL